MIYYLGGVDGWLMFGNNQKLDNSGNVVKKRFSIPATPQPMTKVMHTKDWLLI
jgi:hypothetical protein